MDIYITEMDTGERIAMPMLPESIKLGAGTRFANYQLLRLGEARMPTGTNLTAVSWSAKLPGKKRGQPLQAKATKRGEAKARSMSLADSIRNEATVFPSYINDEHWMLPKKFIHLWDTWRQNKTRLRLMITNTGINLDVYLDNFSGEFTGGFGDYDYSIQFVEARDLTIRTTKEPEALSSEKNKRPQGKDKPTQHTVVKGDSLYRIAEKYLGKGIREIEIYEMNRAVIDGANAGKRVDRYMIYPGQVLGVPGK